LLPLLLPCDDETSPPRRRHVLDWTAEQRDELAGNLERAHAQLRERAERDAPELLARLEEAPPTARARGYGLLPQLRDNHSGAPRARREQLYSLERLSDGLAGPLRDSSVLAARTSEAQPSLALLIDEYERLETRLSNLEDHLAYHEFWQDSVASEPDVYAGRARTLALVREWDTLERAGTNPERVAALAVEVRERLAPVRATPGLSIEREGERARLRVPVHTDIEDAAFRALFEQAVAEEWSAAPDSGELDISLELIVHAPAQLYPEGAPERGAELDIDEHIARFPAGALVLTTGAASTHAQVGRYVWLGADTLSPRMLAHEFGHLLGFRDAYLRAAEGDPDGPFGVVLVEWSGLWQDLMGDARRGRVDAALRDSLLAVYGS